LTGTATNGVDYARLENSVIIPAGGNFIDVIVSPLADNEFESVESVILTIISSVNYTIGAQNTATVTIEDGTTLPTVIIRAVDDLAIEPPTAVASPNTGTFVISRSGGDLSLPLTVNLSIGGTATNGIDYSFIPSSFTIPAGQTSTTITITPLFDTTIEGNETVILSLASSTNYTIGSANTATIKIQDTVNLPTVTIVATDATATEPSLSLLPPTDTGLFTITRSGGDISVPLTVNLSIGGTATNDVDYFLINNTVTIPANQSSVTIPISPKFDTIVEGNESVVLTLLSNPNYTIGSASSATVTIQDTVNLPTVTIVATDATATEPSSSLLPPTDTGLFTITRSGGDLSQPLLVRFDVSGTANNTSDYTLTTSGVARPNQQQVSGGQGIDTRVFDLGFTQGSFSLQYELFTNPDQVEVFYEGSVIFTTGGLASGSATQNLSINGSSSLVTVVISAPNAGTQWNYTLSTSSSTPPLPSSDVFAVIPAGQSSTTVILNALFDSEVEQPETATLTISSDPTYTAGTASSATITIEDGTVILPTVTIVATDATATEPSLSLLPPTDTGLFTITRSGGDISVPLTVNLSIGGTATNDVDYFLINNTVTIPANQSSVTIPISPKFDTIVEGNESVVLTLLSNPNYTIGSASSATVTIQDTVNLPTVTIVATDATATEPSSSLLPPTDTGLFTITRSGGDLSQPLLVRFDVSGTANNTSDYTLTTSGVARPNQQQVSGGQGIDTRVFDLGFTQGSFSLQYELFTNPDQVEVFYEGSVIFTTGGLASGSATQNLSINGSSSLVTVVISAPNAGTQWNYTLSTSSSTPPLPSSDVFAVIPAGQSSTTVILNALFDSEVEQPETATLTISSDPTYTAGTASSATITIEDGTVILPTVTIVATDATATEPSLSLLPPTDTGLFTITRSGGDISVPLTVNLSIGGTATNDVDYFLINNTVTIPANQPSVTIPISPKFDTIVEGNETVILTILSNPNYTIGSASSATVTIQDFVISTGNNIIGTGSQFT
jgi:hypothetical protein